MATTSSVGELVRHWRELGVAALVVLAFLSVNGGQGRRIRNLEHALDAGLNPPVWTADQLAEVESLVGELRQLSPERADDYRRRLHEQFRQDFAEIRALPHVSEEDARRYRENARALDVREPGAGKELLDLLEKRLRAWETIEELQPPFAMRRNPFVRADLRVKDGVRLRTGGHNPVAMLANTPKGSGMRIGAAFDRSWAEVEAVGVYLNADRAHPTEVRSLAFAGPLLASAGRDGVCLWDVGAGPRKTLLQDPGPASCIALSETTLAAGRGREVLVWNLQSATPKREARFEAHGGDVLGIALSGDGRWLATGGKDGTVKVWEMQGTQPLPTSVKTVQELKAAVNQVTFTLDARTLAAACEDGTVRFWDVGQWTPRDFVARHQGPVWSLALSADGTTLAAATRGLVTLWNVREGKEGRRLPAQTEPVHCLAFAFTGPPRVAVGNLVLALDGPPAGRLPEQSRYAGAAAYGERGSLLAVADEADRTVLLCDPHTGWPRTTAERVEGYSFLLARAPLTGRDASEEGHLPRGEGPVGRRYLQILRNGVCLRERAVDVPAGPLRVWASRDGATLEVQVNNLDKLVFQDAFPLPDGRGRFGLHWPVETGLISLVLQHQAREAEASPREEADELFAKD
jgi:hypothetical protein